VRQLLIALLLMGAAGGVAALVRRRTVPDAPSTPRSYAAPVQLDRADFDRPDAPWLVVVFSSATCQTCALVLDKARVVASREVAVQDAEFTAARQLHERYGIDAVPTVVVADADGVVRASFIGPMSATDLWAAVAEARNPGSSPEPGLGRDLS
jgi:protein-disulfide isomerase